MALLTTWFAEEEEEAAEVSARQILCGESLSEDSNEEATSLNELHQSPVCNFKAAKHMCPVCLTYNMDSNDRIFYGGSACHSCRVFFRRTVVSGQNFTCKCVKGGKQKKNNCRKCRFQRCLEQGSLKPELVKILNKREVEGAVVVKIVTPIRPVDSILCADAAAPEYCRVMSKTLSRYLSRGHEQYFDYFLREHEELSAFLLTISGSGLSFTPSMHKALTLMDERIMVNCCFNLVDMEPLSHWDRTKLLTSNVMALHGLRLAWHHSPQTLPRYNMVEYLGFIWGTFRFINHMKDYGHKRHSSHGGYQLMKEGLESASEAVKIMPPTELTWSPLALYHTQV